MDERERTEQEKALENTVEGKFLNDLLNMITDLDNLEYDGSDNLEVVSAINRIEKAIYEAVDLPTDDFKDFPMIKSLEMSAEVISIYLKKWILEIDNFSGYESYNELVEVDVDKLKEAIDRYKKENEGR